MTDQIPLVSVGRRVTAVRRRRVTTTVLTLEENFPSCDMLHVGDVVDQPCVDNPRQVAAGADAPCCHYVEEGAGGSSSKEIGLGTYLTAPV